jgi:UrcA family protein
MPLSSKLALKLALCTAVAVFAASSAFAQEYGPYPPPPRSAYGAPPERVIVIAPRRHYSNERSDIGAPIENVALSRQVGFSDLDLSTPWGARKLRERVRYTAHALCQRLDAQYPVNAPGEANDAFGSTHCYRDAVDDGLNQADAVIAQAQYRD